MRHVLRRSAIIVASSAVIVSGAPLLDSALAASTLTQSSVTPTNGQTATDSHPPISASYTDGGNAATLDSSSTITVTGGPTTVACDSNGTVSGNTITCNYPSATLLQAGTYTITVHAIEASNTANTSDNTSTFTVNVPSRSSSSPTANSRVASISGGKVTVTFNQAVDKDHSTISVQQIADRNADDTFTPDTHTPLTGATTFSGGSMLDANSNPTIEFTPDDSSLAFGIYQVSSDVFGVIAPSTPGSASTENPKAQAKDVFTFTLDDKPLPPPPAPPSPTNLQESPNPVTHATMMTVTFSGNGTPGNTIVVDATDGSNHYNNSGTNNSGPLTVPTCPSTTSCPWSKVFDYTNSGLNEGTINWTATETAAQNSTAFSGSSVPANGPSFTKDIQAPANPHVAGTFSPSNSTELTVTGGSDDTVDHYTLDIQDSASPTHHKIDETLTKAPGGGVAADGTIDHQVDVSSLDDGQLTLTLVAYDADLNSAPAPIANVNKAVGLVLEFNDSFFKQVNNDTPSFPTVLNRQNHAVQKPAQIAIEFSNPITLTRHDTSALNNTPNFNSGGHDIPAAAPSFVEVFPDGSTGNSFEGTQSISTTDPRQLLVTPPAGFADGGYKLHISLWQANQCDWSDTSVPPGGAPNFNPAPCASQWTYDDWIYVPSTTTPFTFTVDSVSPATPTISTLPEGTIDGSNVGDVLIRGTAAGASTVNLTAKSSGGGSVLVLHGGQPVPVDSNGNWQDEESNSSFAAMPDGTITISATAADAAQNMSPTSTDTVSLAARPSIPRSLAVSVTDSSFTLRWQVPSYDGYPAVNGNSTSHITGYRYTYQDTTNGAVDTSVHTVSVANAAATSVTQAGLVTGHSYAVTLCAINNINPTGPCNTINTTAIPAFVTKLTAGISHSIVVYGNPITLSGKLTRADTGLGLSTQPLKVTPRYDNGTTGTVIHINTNTSGGWSVTISKPAKNALYVVTFNDTHANPLYQPANASVRSLIKVSLRIDKVTARSSSHTSPVTIAGHISPNESGRTVFIYARSASASRYQRIGAVKIGSRSTWSFIHTFGRGKFYVVAFFGSQNGVVGANSQTVTITRS